MVTCPITQNYFKNLAGHWAGCVGSAQVHLFGEATTSTALAAFLLFSTA